MQRKHTDKSVMDDPRREGVVRNEKHIAKRKLAHLRPHPRQGELFGDLQGRDFDELVASIAKGGLLQPVEITTEDVVIDGHQRLRAARELGWPEIDVWVRDDLEDQDAINRRHIEANSTRRQLTKLGQARLVKALFEMERGRSGAAKGDARGDTRDRVAKQFGLDGRTAQRWMNVLSAPREVQDACDTGKLPMTLAERVGRMPQAVQDSIASRIREGEDPQAVVEDSLPKATRKSARTTGIVLHLEQLEVILKAIEERNRESDLPPEEARRGLAALDWCTNLVEALREDLGRYVEHRKARPEKIAARPRGAGRSAVAESTEDRR
jgi:ParB/RepB/Spo0J family partition protein